MPFTDSSIPGVQSRRYTAPTTNYGNTSINDALTHGAIADKIRELDKASPGLNLGQRLTTTARDAIVGIMGDARTGGRFDASQPYYQNAVISKLTGIADAANTAHSAALEQGQARQAAAAQRQNNGPLPWQQGLPPSMSRGSINGQDVVVPTAGNYRNGQYAADLMGYAGLSNEAPSYAAVQQGMGKTARAGMQLQQDLKNADAGRDVAVATAKNTAVANTKSAQNEAKYQQKYKSTRGAVKADARQAVDNVLGQYETNYGFAFQDFDKKTGKTRKHSGEEIRALMEQKQMPYIDWSRHVVKNAPGADGSPQYDSVPYIPNRQEMLQNPQYQQWALQRIHDVIGKSKYKDDPETESYAKMYLQQLMGGGAAPQQQQAPPTGPPPQTPPPYPLQQASPLPMGGVQQPMSNQQIAGAAPPAPSPQASPQPTPQQSQATAQASPLPPSVSQLQLQNPKLANDAYTAARTARQNKWKPEQIQNVAQALVAAGHAGAAQAFLDLVKMPGSYGE